MTAPRTALVAGGGIAGAATALALQKAGLEPVVLEARPGRAGGEGAFLTLGSNGLEALRQLGADAPALAAGFPTPAMTLRSGTGKRLGAVPASTARPGGAVSRTLMRSELAALLLAEAERRGIRVEHGRRLAGAEEAGGRVLARFADGGSAEGDLLIGADGVHSVARRVIDPEAPRPRYGGLLNTGGRARGVRSAAEPGHYELIFGRRAFFGHVTAPDGEVWWFANLPRPEEPTAEELRALHGGDLRARLLSDFEDDAGPATALIEAGGEPMPVSPIHSIPHLPRWHRGRMLVVGRRRARAVAVVGAGRLAGDRGRRRPRDLPARRRRSGRGLRPLRADPPAARGADHPLGRAGELEQGRRAGGTGGARRGAAGGAAPGITGRRARADLRAPGLLGCGVMPRSPS